MSDLYNTLVKLGEREPDLQENLAPVLSYLDKRFERGKKAVEYPDENILCDHISGWFKQVEDKIVEELKKRLVGNEIIRESTPVGIDLGQVGQTVEFRLKGRRGNDVIVEYANPEYEETHVEEYPSEMAEEIAQNIIQDALDNGMERDFLKAPYR